MWSYVVSNAYWVVFLNNEKSPNLCDYNIKKESVILFCKKYASPSIVI
jgi:hypothetical protein